MDRQSSTLYTSPQIEAILGFTQAEWMADHTRWLKQIHPDDRDFVLKELARIHAGGEPNSCEFRMLTHDGDVRWFMDDSAVVRDTDGYPLALYGVGVPTFVRSREHPRLPGFQLRRDSDCGSGAA